MVQSQTNRLLSTMPSLLLLYLKFRKDKSTALTVWWRVLETVGRSPEEFDAMFPALLDAAESKQLPAYLRPQGEELEQAAGSLLVGAAYGEQSPFRLSLIRRILVSYGMYYSPPHLSLLTDSDGLASKSISSPPALARSFSAQPRTRSSYCSRRSCTTTRRP